MQKHIRIQSNSHRQLNRPKIKMSPQEGTGSFLDSSSLARHIQELYGSCNQFPFSPEPRHSKIDQLELETNLY